MRKYSFKIHGNKYSVFIKKIEGRNAIVEVNGSEYSVEIDKEMAPKKTPQLVRPRVQTSQEEANIPKAQASAGIKPIKSPLPGLVMKMIVGKGDTVKKGDKLMILEAMKMENDVLSDVDGTVEEIKVREGDSVLEGDVLITIS
jgi:biotin carboxyl carrier protein